MTHTIIFSNIVYFFAHSSQGEHLLKATTPEQIKRVLMTEARTLSSKRLSALSERLFMGEMRNELGIRVTDTNAVANDLFEAVEAEEKRWNEGVAGLDDAMVSVKCCFFYGFFWKLLFSIMKLYLYTHVKSLTYIYIKLSSLDYFFFIFFLETTTQAVKIQLLLMEMTMIQMM